MSIVVNNNDFITTYNYIFTTKSFGETYDYTFVTNDSIGVIETYDIAVDIKTVHVQSPVLQVSKTSKMRKTSKTHKKSYVNKLSVIEE